MAKKRELTAAELAEIKRREQAGLEVDWTRIQAQLEMEAAGMIKPKPLFNRADNTNS